MEKITYTLECMFQEKLSLYMEMKEVFEQEKKYIADMDVDSLWKTTDRKKKMGTDIVQIRTQILALFENNNIRLNMGIKSFSISDIIKALPAPDKTKSNLKEIKIKLELVKKELAGLASANGQYIRQYLSVIHGIFATITGTGNEKKEQQYTSSGMVMKGNARPSILRAEV